MFRHVKRILPLMRSSGAAVSAAVLQTGRRVFLPHAEAAAADIGIRKAGPIPDPLPSYPIISSTISVVKSLSFASSHVFPVFTIRSD
jgi:hypothetical protein